jgi:hypothetical protein
MYKNMPLKGIHTQAIHTQLRSKCAPPHKRSHPHPLTTPLRIKHSFPGNATPPIHFTPAGLAALPCGGAQKHLLAPVSGVEPQTSVDDGHKKAPCPKPDRALTLYNPIYEITIGGGES